MSQTPPHIDDQEKFRRLQELLLEDDRDVSAQIKTAIDELRKDMVSPEEIRVRVEPFIENKVQYLQDNFPELFGHVLADTIKQQIKDSQDEMVDALYPIIGKLIRKFVAKEMERLIAQIDRSIDDTFSFAAWKRRFRSWFRGESRRDQIFKEIAKAEIEEIFLVDQNSGLLAGSWSRTELTDRDMVAGMLTAIKSFVETAFAGGEQDLEMIEYDNYKIVIQNFRTYYVAVLVSGIVTPEFKDMLAQMLLSFAEKNPVDSRGDLNENIVQQNSLALKSHLHHFLNEDQ